MCHRSGDEPPVLLFAHFFSPIVLANARHRIRSTRAPVAQCHGSVDVSRKIEVGAHFIDPNNSYALYFER
jgi:hypothetical protein